jgi:hypothetical protein
MSTVPLHISFFVHANLQYAEIPSSFTARLIEQSYLPTCELFLGRPWAKAVLEYSGYTLEVLSRDYPQVIERVRTLIQRGQVELCGSTYANPILPLIPLDHARKQILAFRDIYDDLFGDLGIEPVGFYPQEFAVDPSLVPLIREAGYEWVPVFLNHYLESVTGRMNSAHGGPDWSVGHLRRETGADLMHPFRFQGANGTELVGILNSAPMIELLFQVARRSITVHELVGSVLTMHERYSATGPAFVFLGPSDMEFLGVETGRREPGAGWTHSIRIADLGAILDRLREVEFVRFSTAREYLAEHAPVGEAIYLKCGSDGPGFEVWTLDPDNARLNHLCQEASQHIRLAEHLLPLANRNKGVGEAYGLLEEAWRAMLLAENSDGRGFVPLPERRLFCYSYALRAIELAERALALMK